MAKAVKFPKTLGECADLIYQTRESRLALQKQVAEIEAYEKMLKEHVINNLPKSQLEGAQGKVARVTVVKKQIPQVEDWPAFHEYVRKHKAFELLQRRLSVEAVAERLDAGKILPGVKIFTAVSLSVNKV